MEEENIPKKIILSRENAEYLLGKGIANKRGIYLGSITKLMNDGLRLDTGAYILYDCCLNNYEIVKPVGKNKES